MQPTVIQQILLALSLTVSALFFVYGYNCFYLLYSAKRYAVPAAGSLKGKPTVAIHLPIYNEKYVARRVIYSCAKVAECYGVELVRILVLDDSDDDTSDEVNRVVEDLGAQGFRIEVLRRADRSGYKAGALQKALEVTSEKYICVFDADFIPPSDFLLKVIPYMEADESLGLVQARWTHVNRGYNYVTKAVSLGIDGHFLIEQPGRLAAGCFLNFNGSAGVLRREALVKVGGWQADTLAEDLDVSYRMQLEGYRVLYVRDVCAPAEVPPSISGFKRQQARWACGSVQVAKKHLVKILLRKDLSLKQKFEAFTHLTYYFVHPLILAAFILAAFASILNVNTIGFDMPQPSSTSIAEYIRSLEAHNVTWLPLGAAILTCWAAVWVYYVASVRQQRLGLIRSLPALITLGFIGYGVSVSNTIQVLRALLSSSSQPFLRTPKYAIERSGDDWRGKKYQVLLDATLVIELLTIVLGAASIASADTFGNLGILPILVPYTASYVFVASLTIYHSRGAGSG